MVKISLIQEDEYFVKLQLESRTTSTEDLKELDQIYSAISSSSNTIEFGYTNSSTAVITLKV